MISPYKPQVESLYACFEGGGWDRVRSGLVNLPTGCGKTFVAAICAKRIYAEKGKRTLFAVHLREIVRDARDEISEISGLDVGLELASQKSSSLVPEPVICASIQTLNGKGRLQKFNPDEFGLIVIDEGHHGVCDSWKKVLDYFPNAKVLVLTATPERTDKKKLGAIVDEIFYQYSLKQACDDGYLVRPRQFTVTIPGLDFSKIPRKQGELDKAKLEEILIRYATQCVQGSIEAMYDLYPHELDAVPENKWSEYVGDKIPKKTLVFCVTTLHAEKVCNAFNSFREGLCGYVDGTTHHIERRDTIQKFKNGVLAGLVTVGIAYEGFNVRGIELILDMAPTMSHSRELQKIGRGTRTLPGVIDGIENAEDRLIAIANSEKPFCSIVDFTDNSRDHRLVTVLDIFGKDQPKSVRRELEKRASEKAIDAEQEIKLILKERYELGQTDFTRDEIDGFTGKKKKKKLSKEQKEARRLAREQSPISPKNWDRLVQQKLEPEKRSTEENKALLKRMTHRRLAGLCTFRQGFLLAKYGYTKEQLSTMKFYEAKEAIDRIAANGWRRVA